jgi:hypothetical protein
MGVLESLFCQVDGDDFLQINVAVMKPTVNNFVICIKMNKAKMFTSLFYFLCRYKYF